MGQLELMLACPNAWFCAKAAGARDVADDAVRSRPEHVGAFGKMVLAQGLGDEDRQASRLALARRLAVIMHRVWVDGTAFRWTREIAPA